MTSPSAERKVLVAVRPQDLSTVSDALGSEFDLIVCHTLDEVKAHLDDDIGLIACGVRFDNGAMFDLVRLVKQQPNTKDIPIYLMAGDGVNYSKPILDGIRSAAK